MYIVIIKFTDMNDNIYEGIAEGNPVSILVFAIVAVLFIMFYLNGMDMGTHPDTGRPVKSFNTKEGKRAGQRRRYNQKKYPEKYAAVVEAIEADFEEHGIDSIRKNNYEIFEQNIEMVEAGLYECRPDAGPDPLDMFDFPEDE